MENKAPLNGREISDILRTLPDNFSTSDITIGELRDALSGRAYGILLLVLTFPNLIPIPAPGLSAILGMPLILITFQLMLGVKTPWLPEFIARRRIKREHLQRVCIHITPYIGKLELIITPRLKFLVQSPFDHLIAFICVLLSLMIMLPIPLANALPALAICLFAMAMLQRNGLFVILGIIVTIIATAVILTFSGAIFLSVLTFFSVF